MDPLNMILSLKGEDDRISLSERSLVLFEFSEIKSLMHLGNIAVDSCKACI